MSQPTKVVPHPRYPDRSITVQMRYRAEDYELMTLRSRVTVIAVAVLGPEGAPIVKPNGETERHVVRVPPPLSYYNRELELTLVGAENIPRRDGTIAKNVAEAIPELWERQNDVDTDGNTFGRYILDLLDEKGAAFFDADPQVASSPTP